MTVLTATKQLNQQKGNRMTITTKIETITPEIALQYLATNKKNRPLTRATVEMYATDMRAEKWRLNGESIIFDKNGVLANGQHRLTACIRAEVSFESFVVYGVDDDAFQTMDTGKKRSASDVLAIDGEASTVRLASIARGHFRNRNGYNTRAANLLSVSGTLDEIHAYPAIKHIATCGKLSNNIYGAIKGAGLGAFAYAYTLGWTDEIDYALELLGSGEHFGADDPIWVLRERILAQRSSKESLKASAFNAYVVKALNAFLQGRTIKVLRLSTEESYPVLIAKKAAS